jgi:acyl carrier protein
MDDQVKIAGYRIEPGEIEAALESHAAVAQTCVVARADDGRAKRLIAYYVPLTANAVSVSELRGFLAQRLPQYMIPAQFVELSELPLSSTGKVDRSALPEPRDPGSAKSVDGAVSNRLEQMIAEQWRRVLGVEQIGLDDNFFDLGGDSLQLLAIHSRLQKSAALEIPIMDLFEFTTVRELAKRLGGPGKAHSFSGVDAQAEKQRAAFARMRDQRAGGLP